MQERGTRKHSVKRSCRRHGIDIERSLGNCQPMAERRALAPPSAAPTVPPANTHSTATPTTPSTKFADNSANKAIPMTTTTAGSRRNTAMSRPMSIACPCVQAIRAPAMYPPMRGDGGPMMKCTMGTAQQPRVIAAPTRAARNTANLSKRRKDCGKSTDGRRGLSNAEAHGTYNALVRVQRTTDRRSRSSRAG